MISLRSVVMASAVLLTTACTSGASQENADSYPSKTVNVIATAAAGGITDLNARVLSQCLGTNAGETFVVENREGGGGVIGAAELVKTKPDGYTIGVTTLSITALGPLTTPGAGYAASDFTPIAAVSTNPSLLVAKADSGLATMDEFLATSQGGGQVSVGVPGAAGIYGLTMNSWKKSGMGLRVVPFNSNDLTITAVLGGNLDAGFIAVSATVLAQIDSGKLRVLGTGAEERLDYLPEVPTFVESGIKDVPPTSAVLLVVGPPKLPAEIAKELEAQVATCVQVADFRSKLGEDFVLDKPMGGAEVAEMIAEASRAWADLA